MQALHDACVLLGNLAKVEIKSDKIAAYAVGSSNALRG
jgi:hypothetical protein